MVMINGKQASPVAKSFDPAQVDIVAMDNTDYDVSSSSSDSESEAGDVAESSGPLGDSNVELTLVDDECVLIQPSEDNGEEDGPLETSEYLFYFNFQWP